MVPGEGGVWLGEHLMVPGGIAKRASVFALLCFVCSLGVISVNSLSVTYIQTVVVHRVHIDKQEKLGANIFSL